MKQIIGLNIAGCLWFMFFGFSVAMADAPARIEYTAAGLRSPFKRQFPEAAPLVNPQDKAKPKAKDKAKKITPPPQIVLEGIIAGREAAYAIIAGKVFRLGDKVGDALITGITKEGVEVVCGGGGGGGVRYSVLKHPRRSSE